MTTFSSITVRHNRHLDRRNSDVSDQWIAGWPITRSTTLFCSDSLYDLVLCNKFLKVDRGKAGER